MTVQFILPETTSFPKERKLHDRLFLVLLYNLLCKTFKDHSSAFAASALSERNPLLQERCFPIASAKVEHFCIPCKTSPKKKCEKISFAPILPLHNIAKSALKPIFSPLPHPTFFAPKSPFFPLFPVLDSISGDFSRNRSRFLPCEAHFFSSFPILSPTSGDFSMARPRFSPFYRLFSFPFSHFETKSRRFSDVTSLFSTPNFNFSSLRPVLPHTSDISSRDPTLYYRHTSLFALRKGFFISCFPHSSRPAPPSYFPLISFPSLIPPYLHPSPSFSHIPPHFSISLPNKRTIARTLAHYARTPAHTHTSGGFRFFPSPLHPPSTIRCTSTH